MNLEGEIVTALIQSLGEALPRFGSMWGAAITATPALPEQLALQVRNALGDDRRAMAHFIDWWGRRGHLARHEHAKAHNDAPDFRTCPNALCISLAGTRDDLIKQLPANLPYDRRSETRQSLTK